ncbi:MAG: benzoate/H(+) symporter BenE family transporter, partial [Halomonas sp.]|nr:benzoate/H(+) symporter BenE family transporter [Halomonas sp.]
MAQETTDCARPTQASSWRDMSPSSLTAGFVAVLVGYTSSAAIIFQAAEAAGAST